MNRLTWGGYLGLSPSCLEGLFHFTACLSRPPHTPIALAVVLILLINAVASYRWPKSLFSLPFYPSTFPSSILRSFAGSAFLCSAVTLSSLARVFLRAYSVLDTEFYCHSYMCRYLGIEAVITPSVSAYVLSASNLGHLKWCIEAHL